MKSLAYTFPLLTLLVTGCGTEQKHHFEPVAETLAYPKPVILAASTSAAPAITKSVPAPVIEKATPAPPAAPVKPATADASGVTIQAARFLNGRVTTVNASADIAVVNFPIGQLPVIEQKLAVYRHGVRVGEIKITGPQRDDNIVADILSGEIQPGDEARSR